MSLGVQDDSESALCLYSWCNFVYIPDVTSDSKRKRKCIVSIFRMPFCLYSGCHFCFKHKNYKTKHCVYIPDANLSIFRMSRLLKHVIKMHCVYIPDAILSTLWMSLLLWKDNENALCLYSGCHFVYIPDVTFVSKRQWKWLCLYSGCYDVYIPDVTSAWKNENALCLYSGRYAVYIPDVTSVTKKSMKVHGVYIPDAISSILRMSL